jgi:protein-disulfide isomerase
MSRQSATSKLSPPVGDRDHIQGSTEAPLTLVEYGDYQCPYCGLSYSVVKELQKKLGDQLRFVFRNFPLAMMHPDAEHAAEAAEAASAHGEFWEMHDLLYENQEALSDDDLLRYAAALDLDLSHFAKDLDAHAYAARVHEDFISGARSGVNGTPSFFINGVRHDGGYDFESLLAALEQEL